MMVSVCSEFWKSWLEAHATPHPSCVLPSFHPERYQLEIVRYNGLPPLLRLLKSTFLPLILSSAACVRNVSIHPDNESPIIQADFLIPLIDLLAYDDNEEIQCHAISTLRNLAASSESNKAAIVKAGAVERIKELVLQVPLSVQSEMTACMAVLGLSDDIKGQLLEMGVLNVLIPLTASSSVEVQGNSAAAIGNLSAKGLGSGSSHCAFVIFFLADTLFSFRHRLPQPTTTTPSAQRGPLLLTACTATLFASSRRPTPHSNILPSGPSSNCWNLAMPD